MVVAQIPLWILHSASVSGGLSTASHLPGATGTASSNGHAGGDSEAGLDGGKKEAQSHLNLWTNASTTERRSAIYCCDIALGRIATGGGDGKIRLWGLTSLFHSSKSDPNAKQSTTDADHDGGSAERRKKLANFQKTGGYESSDSSGSSASERTKNCAASTSITNENGGPDLNTNANSDNDKEEVEDDVHDVNDLTMLVRRKNSKEPNESNRESVKKITNTPIGSPNGKKRKRAELQNKPIEAIDTLSSAPDPKNPKQRLLCTLSSHSGSVLSLRFSSTGTYLASAGDDAHVFIYTRSSKPSPLAHGNLLNPSNSSGSDEKDIEHWNRIRMLRGHNLDVVGLAWAPDDSHLVSCSLDSTAPICVWRLNLANHQERHGQQDNAPQARHDDLHGSLNHNACPIIHPFKVLGKNIHTSTVKGVAFDPAGKYVASSGDDPAICIWRAFDDWGLEERIDSSAGIFHSKTQRKTSQNTDDSDFDDEEEDVQALASLSLFRRISFAPDGTHVCGTNATLRGKNIAAMISREGWGVSAPRKNSSNGKRKSKPAAGAANLVGHKQPVVSSRHCPYFFEVQKQPTKSMEEESNVDDDDEPQYSTLIALGDKKGFVTIWSTRKSRPIFKVQCSESRCTVTDMCWGLVQPPKPNTESKTLVMLISLLDGYVVALSFNIQDELGTILPDEKKHKIFRMKYGIELGSENGIGSSRRRLVDDKSGPKLIENVLQYTMEDDADQQHSKGAHSSSSEDENNDDNDDDLPQRMDESETNHIRGRSDMGETNIGFEGTTKETSFKGSKGTSENNVKNIFRSAEEAALGAEGVSLKSAKRDNFKMDGQGRPSEKSMNRSSSTTTGVDQTKARVAPRRIARNISREHSQAPLIDVTNQTTFTVNLFESSEESDNDLNFFSEPTTVKTIASCTNSIQKPPGYIKSIPCTTLSISCNGKVTWKDQILGLHCSAIASSSTSIVVGTTDGTIYVYGTSPSSGWKSGVAFRSHPPFILGNQIVRLLLKNTTTTTDDNDNDEQQTEKKKKKKRCTVENSDMLVVTANGDFAIYKMIPSPKLHYKGSIIAPMNQIRLTSQACSNNPTNNDLESIPYPSLIRIQITESDQLLLLLSQASSSRSGGNIGGVSSFFGGTLQGYLYNRDMEVWMRISDSRFIFSDLYSTVPSTKLKSGPLSKLDQAIQSETSRRGGSSSSGSTTTIPGGRGGGGLMSGISSSGIYQSSTNTEDNTWVINYTRAHCEDRIACSIAMKSKSDFRFWLCQYIRQLSIMADMTHLRLVIDMLLHKVTSTEEGNGDDFSSSGDTSSSLLSSSSSSSYWWLSSAESILGWGRREIVEKIVIPEMSKNRALQRMTNEIATEMSIL